jgi:hypothetical protein
MTLPLILQLVFGGLCLAAVGAALVGAYVVYAMTESADAAARDALSGSSRRDRGRCLSSGLRALLPVPALRLVPVVARNHRNRERLEHRSNRSSRRLT